MLENLKTILGWDLTLLNLLENSVDVMASPPKSQSNYAEIFKLLDNERK